MGDGQQKPGQKEDTHKPESAAPAVDPAQGTSTVIPPPPPPLPPPPIVPKNLAEPAATEVPPVPAMAAPPKLPAQPAPAKPTVDQAAPAPAVAKPAAPKPAPAASVAPVPAVAQPAASVGKSKQPSAPPPQLVVPPIPAPAVGPAPVPEIPIKADGKIHAYLVSGYDPHADQAQQKKIIQAQVKKMVDDFKEKIKQDPQTKIAITYSANGEQAADLIASYDTGIIPAIGGSGQAVLFNALGQAINEDKDLKGKVHILPISTCKKPGGNPLIDDTDVARDIGNLTTHLEEGYIVLGMQNVASAAKQHYAIGGGVVSTQKWQAHQQGQEITQQMQQLTDIGVAIAPAAATKKRKEATSKALAATINPEVLATVASETKDTDFLIAIARNPHSSIDTLKKIIDVVKSQHGDKEKILAAVASNANAKDLLPEIVGAAPTASFDLNRDTIANLQLIGAAKDIKTLEELLNSKAEEIYKNKYILEAISLHPSLGSINIANITEKGDKKDKKDMIIALLKTTNQPAFFMRLLESEFKDDKECLEALYTNTSVASGLSINEKQATVLAGNKHASPEFLLGLLTNPKFRNASATLDEIAKNFKTEDVDKVVTIEQATILAAHTDKFAVCEKLLEKFNVDVNARAAIESAICRNTKVVNQIPPDSALELAKNKDASPQFLVALFNALYKKDPQKNKALLEAIANNPNILVGIKTGVITQPLIDQISLYAANQANIKQAIAKFAADAAAVEAAKQKEEQEAQTTDDDAPEIDGEEVGLGAEVTQGKKAEEEEEEETLELSVGSTVAHDPHPSDSHRAPASDLFASDAKWNAFKKAAGAKAENTSEDGNTLTFPVTKTHSVIVDRESGVIKVTNKRAPEKAIAKVIELAKSMAKVSGQDPYPLVIRGGSLFEIREVYKQLEKEGSGVELSVDPKVVSNLVKSQGKAAIKFFEEKGITIPPEAMAEPAKTKSEAEAEVPATKAKPEPAEAAAPVPPAPPMKLPAWPPSADGMPASKNPKPKDAPASPTTGFDATKDEAIPLAEKATAPKQPAAVEVDVPTDTEGQVAQLVAMIDELDKVMSTAPAKAQSVLGEFHDKLSGIIGDLEKPMSTTEMKGFISEYKEKTGKEPPEPTTPSHHVGPK